MRDGICALCVEPKLLCHSHILPEFLYTSLYDSNHKFERLSSDPDMKDRKEQKGIREYLLCKGCEGKVNVLETYAEKVIKRDVEPRCVKHERAFAVSGIDYATFKLFGMSLLWRAGVSKRPEFADVDLGPHSEELRQRIYAGDPGRAHEYPFNISFPTDQQLRRIYAQAMNPPMFVGRLDGAHVYMFILGLPIWYFTVTTREGNNTHLSLTETGTLRLFEGGEITTRFLRTLARQITTKKG